MKRTKTGKKDERGNDIHVGDVLSTFEFDGENEHQVFYVVKPMTVMMAVPVESDYDEEWESLRLSKLRTLGNRELAGFRIVHDKLSKHD